MRLRICKVCGVRKEFNGLGVGDKARGFHGKVCYGCVLEEQRAWRGTQLGRDEANEASRAYRRRRDAHSDAAAERDQAGHDCVSHV